MAQFEKDFLSLLDGTGVRLQGPKGVDRGRADISWALASQEENTPFEPVGFWVKESSKKIREDLKNRLNYDCLQGSLF